MNVRRRSDGGSASAIKGAVSQPSGGSGGVKAIKNSVAVQNAKNVKVKGAVALKG